MEATVGKSTGNGTGLVGDSGPELDETEKKMLDYLTRNQTDRRITLSRLSREADTGSATPAAVSGLLRKKLIKMIVTEDGPATFRLNEDGPRRHARPDKRARDPKSEAINAKIKLWLEHKWSSQKIAKKIRLTEAAVTNRIFNMRLRGEIPGTIVRGPRQPTKAKKVETAETEVLDSAEEVFNQVPPKTDEGEEEDDEPKVLRQEQPDVGEIIEGVRDLTEQVEKQGWKIEVVIKLTFPNREVDLHLGAS